MAYDPAAWQNFFLMTGSAAAALTGLLFVAMSLHAKAIVTNRLHGSRARLTLLSLATQLVLAAAVLVPGQSLAALGLEVEITALLFVGFAVRSVIIRGWTPGSGQVARVRRGAEVILGQFGNVLFVGAGLSLLLGSGGGLYLLALWMLLAFVVNIYIAWVLVAEVSD